MEAKEDNITCELQQCLVKLTDSDIGKNIGFTLAIFSLPSRGANITNYDGQKINKQPDLTFYLATGKAGLENQLDYGLFVECKPIDAQHSLKAQYCEAGIIRYINGDYAWAVPDAMMIGYVRYKKKKAVLPDDLNNCLDIKNTNPYQIMSEITICPENTNYQSLPICCTTHNRNFSSKLISQPSNITIRHIWLEC
jgi:hypothetical protein